MERQPQVQNISTSRGKYSHKYCCHSPSCLKIEMTSLGPQLKQCDINGSLTPPLGFHQNKKVNKLRNKKLIFLGPVQPCSIIKKDIQEEISCELILI